MKLSVTSLLFAVLAVSAADARIGESQEQCIARYGRPIEKVNPGKMVIFMKEEFGIGVEFHHGKADKLVFVKMSGKIGGRFSIPMNDKEVMMLLAANGGGRKWNKLGGNVSRTLWMSNDAQMMADRNSVTGELVISTKAYMEREIAGVEVDEAKKLKGF